MAEAIDLRPVVTAAKRRTPLGRYQSKMPAMTARPRHASLSLILALALGLGFGTLGCGDEDDEIGTPCETADDCSGDLICDIHEGQGTCQEPHDH